MARLTTAQWSMLRQLAKLEDGWASIPYGTSHRTLRALERMGLAKYSYSPTPGYVITEKGRAANQDFGLDEVAQ